MTQSTVQNAESSTTRPANVDRIERDKMMEQMRDCSVDILVIRDVGPEKSFGSGVVISPHLILTEAHVIQKFRERWPGRYTILVNHLGRYLEAKVYDFRYMTGTAVLDVVDKGIELYPVAILADSIKQADILQKLHSVGSPRGLGIVMLDGRLQSYPEKKDKDRVVISGRVAITSIPASEGMSGGPVFAKIDGDFKVVGINRSIILYPQRTLLWSDNSTSQDVTIHLPVPHFTAINPINNWKDWVEARIAEYHRSPKNPPILVPRIEKEPTPKEIIDKYLKDIEDIQSHNVKENGPHIW